MNLRRDWNEFFFARIPAALLGIYRIVAGALVVFWALLLTPDLWTWYSQHGAFPIAAMHAYTPTSWPMFNLLGEVTDFRITAALFVVMVVAAMLLCVGLFTRISAIVTLLLVVSFHHRDPMILNGGDTLMRVMLFYLALSPCGEACSIDRLRAIAAGKIKQSAVPMIEAWSVRLMQLQVSILYISAALEKMQGAAWQNGTAVYYPFHLTEQVRFPVGVFGTSLLLINLLTYSSVAIEASLGTLIWVPRLRPYVLLAGVTLHLGIEYSINIPMFEFTMMSTYILFLRSEWLVSLQAHVARLFKQLAVKAQYRQFAQVETPLVSALRSLDAVSLVQFEPVTASDATALTVTDRAGRQTEGVPAIRALTHTIPMLRLALPALVWPPTFANLYGRLESSAPLGDVAPTPPKPVADPSPAARV